MAKTKTPSKSAKRREQRLGPAMERRCVCPSVDGFDVRAAEDGQAVTVSGYAAVFGQESYGEVLRAGCFTKTLAEDNQYMLWSHDPSKPIANRAAGTLKLAQDEFGLRFEATLEREGFGQAACVALERGDVQKMSFGFRAVRVEITERDDDVWLREVLEAELFEVSPVVWPWYEGTSVDVTEKDAAPEHEMRDEDGAAAASSTANDDEVAADQAAAPGGDQAAAPGGDQAAGQAPAPGGDQAVEIETDETGADAADVERARRWRALRLKADVLDRSAPVA